MTALVSGRLADEATRFLVEWKRDDLWLEVRRRALVHLRHWPTLLGIQVIEQLDLTDDGAPLIEEATRALAITAAAYCVAGEDLAPMLPVPIPVQEASHALMVQVDLLRALADRSGVRLVHRTMSAPLPYRAGCLTHDAYRQAWDEPPARYWLAHETVTARQDHLLGLYSWIGAEPGRHNIVFP
jgi:hypothetical protein